MGIQQVTHEMDHESLIRIFNSAIVSSQTNEGNLSAQLQELMERPETRSIIQSILSLSQQEGLDFQVAAERVISTFRELDQVWRVCLIREGVEKLRSSSN